MDNILSKLTLAPYETYKRLRTEGGIHRSDSMGAWIITRHEFIKACMSNPTLVNDRLFGTEARKYDSRAAALMQMMSYWPAFAHGENHRKGREIFRMLFSGNSMARFDQVMTTCRLFPTNTTHLPRYDVVKEFITPIVDSVTIGVLGLPEQVRNEFATVCQVVERHLFGATAETNVEKLHTDLMALLSRLRSLFEGSSDEFVPEFQAIGRAFRHGDTNEQMRIFSVLINAYVAIHGPLQMSLGNIVGACLTNPEVANYYTSPGFSAERCVIEILRFDPPMLIAGRIALSSCELFEHEIEKGDRVNLMLGAGNHDELVFSQPDRLIFDRPNDDSLTFGAGSHHCFGERLAVNMLATICKYLLREAKLLTLLCVDAKKQTTLGASTYASLIVSGTQGQPSQ